MEIRNGATTSMVVGLFSILLFFAFTFGTLNPAAAQPLPDLVVSDIQVDNECRLRITLRNVGQGPVLASAYQAPGGATVSFYKNGATFGGWGLNTIDPQRKLSTPGASVTWLREGHKIEGSVQIRVVVDAARNIVAESDETNNGLTKSFSCTPKLPDARVSQISFTSDCRAHIRLENIGDDALPDSAFRSEGAYIQRYLDGKLAGKVMLTSIDQARALQPPGGSKEWTDSSEYRATQTVKYAIKSVGQEKSLANNALQVTVPSNCQLAVQSPPDLAVADISLDSACRLVLTLKNNGGPMPQSAYDPIGSPSINFKKDGASFGGWSLNTIDPQKVLTTAGATVTWVRQQPTISGRVEIRVILDSAKELTESNENNNSFTKTLRCGPGLPDLAIMQVSFTNNCRPRLQLKNTGDVALPDELYLSGGAYLNRIVDGRSAGRILLSSIDPKKVLKAVGGTISWIDSARFGLGKTISYQLAGIDEEERTDNNLGTANVPSRCRTKVKAPKTKRPIKRVPRRIRIKN